MRSGGISSSTLARLRQLATPEAVLRLAGCHPKPDGSSRLKARCPLPGHGKQTGKSPPFTAYQDGGWKCFGCQAGGGDGISLHQTITGLSFRDAAEDLAKIFHIPLKVANGSRPDGHRPRPSAQCQHASARDPGSSWSASVEPPPDLQHPRHGRPLAWWRIADAEGRLFAVHALFQSADGKKLVLWWQNGAWSLQGLRVTEAPLYGSERLGQVSGDDPVFVAEGEKAADALACCGVQAVGTVTGAGGTPGASALEPLRGRRVVLWPDRDEVGREHMGRIASALKGVAEDVRSLDSGQLEGLPGKGGAQGQDGDGADAVEWIENRDAVEVDVLRSQLLRLAEEGPFQEAEPEIQTDYRLTDLGNAERFRDQHGRDLRYCRALRTWMVWTGSHWKPDSTGATERRAKDSARSILETAAKELDDDRRAALVKHAARTEAAPRLAAMVKLARTEKPIAARTEDFDRHPWLLTCPNGTLDLKAGRLRPHRRGDLITRALRVPFDPEARCPSWLRFLEVALCGSQDLVTFLQRAVGYSLTGIVASPKALFILHGDGDNGKSVFTETLLELFSDYGTRTDSETLLASSARERGAQNDLAQLRGVRFAVAQETDAGRRLAEARIKAITGGDQLVGRFLYSEPFVFHPTFKLWLATNHQPEIRGTDTGIWSRVRLVPFEVHLPTVLGPGELRPFAEVMETMKAELPGILA